jgi:dihydrodipicolinate synthase/N-acetylneuraminate lyase
MNESTVGRHLAALVVPFKDSLEIDEAALKSVCQHMLKVDGIDALVVNANAGEVDALSESERMRVFEIARDEAHAAGKRVVASVVPFPGTNAAAARTAREMQDAGADSLLLLGPPAFGRGVEMVPEVAEQYARDVASSVSIPIVYFMAGPLSGINYTPEVVKRICSVDNIVGIKDTMWTPQGYEANMKMLRKMGRGTTVLSGNDNCLLQNFISGADGTLLILHLVMAKSIIEMYNAVAANDVAKAKEISDRHEVLVALLFQRPMLKMATRVKFVLKLLGVIPNDITRAPVPGLTPEEIKAITEQVSKLNLA